MARIAGVDLPDRKRIEIALTYIYGIGRTTSNKILAKANIFKDKKTHDLTTEELTKLRDIIQQEYTVEGALRTKQKLNIKRLMEIGCYRGLRHRRGLPVNGQRTHTNARTWKGPRKNRLRKR